MRSKSVVQLILFITSAVIIFTYIKPSYKNLQSLKTESDVYANAIESADQFNTELKKQLAAAESLTTAEKEALERYLPLKIDTVAVMRDLEIITQLNNMEISVLAATEAADGKNDSENAYYEDGTDTDYVQGQVPPEKLSANSAELTMTVRGFYEDFKSLLHDLERNAYPLEITSLTVTPTGTSGSAESAAVDTGSGEAAYTFNIKMETYQFVSEGE